jgi:DNA-binding MarR family transcriptional regulator
MTTTNSTHHLHVLRALDGAGHVPQRRVAQAVGVATSRVNRIIHSLVRAEYVEVADEAVRPFAYRITPSGREYLQELSYDHYSAVVGRYREVQERIRTRLRDLRTRGVKRVIFYGAGEVMEVAYPLAAEVELEVVAVVDDDPAKHGRRGGIEVVSPARLTDGAPDAVVITTLRHRDQIRGRLAGPSSTRVVEL